MASFALIGFSYTNPIVGLSIFSVSLTVGPIALISAVPLLLPLSAVGTALGLYKCGINVGATIMDPLSGLIQDIYGEYARGPRHQKRTRTRLTHCADDRGGRCTPPPPPGAGAVRRAISYDEVMVAFLVFGGLSVLIAAVFWFLDRRRFRGILTANEAQRRLIEKERGENLQQVRRASP